jgi:hypothetical protein
VKSPLFKADSQVRIGAALGGHWMLCEKSDCTAAWMRCCSWHRGIRSMTLRGTLVVLPPQFAGGLGVICKAMMRKRLLIVLAAGARVQPRTLAHNSLLLYSPAILANLDTGQRHGQYPYWRPTCVPIKGYRSAPAPCVGGFMKDAFAGSVRATSIANGPIMRGRKKGAHPPPQGRRETGRRRVLYRLDAAAAVSTIACGVGARGYASACADQWGQCAPGAVWRHSSEYRPAHCAGAAAGGRS